jgi:hypothetical protein
LWLLDAIQVCHSADMVDMLSARKLVNGGDYTGALAALGDGSFEVGDDPALDGARRLAGCLMLVLGRCRDGLSLLETSRASGVQATFPRLEYHKTANDKIGEARLVAIGFLECLGLGISAIEVAQGGNAFHDVETLRSLRYFALALRTVNRDAEAGLADQLFVRWVEAVDDPWQIDGLFESLLESGDEETATIVRTARA